MSPFVRLFLAVIVLFWALPAFCDEASPAPQAESESHESEFTDEIQRDFNLRSIEQIQFTNLRGDISVQGWSQDKIRVRAKRRVFAASDAAAKIAFSAMDVRFNDLLGSIECSAEYGKNLDISQRLEERERPVELQSKMDLVISAPSRLKLKIWSAGGRIFLKSWGNSAELRSISGDILAESVRAGEITSLCQNCSARFKEIRGSIRAITDGGNLSVTDLDGENVFLESGAGDITAQRVSAEQLYVTKSGQISAKALHGHVEFQTQQGAVELTGLHGFASGRTEAGSIRLSADEWDFHDRALIESASGDISLLLPGNFAAEVDIRSVRGKVNSAFSVSGETTRKSEPNHLQGRIGEETTDLLKVFSESGNIEIRRLDR